MKDDRTCIAMSFNSNMFHQAQECIKTILQHCKYNYDICVLGLQLKDEEKTWLKENRVVLRDDYENLPTFINAPSHIYALTCRPYLRELFPGYHLYMWIDADIRITESNAFDFYICTAQTYKESVVIAMEIDIAYIFVNNINSACCYHSEKNRRILEVYGEDTASLLRHQYYFNAGIFAMSYESVIWERYTNNLLRSLSFQYDGIREQDAMNVAILESGMVCIAPSVMNWLCSASQPLFDKSIGKWVRPSYPNTPISVLHLTASNQLYEYYRSINLTQ